MVKQDPRIDAYIERSAPFAQPVLRHFRTLIHRICPEAEETWKWNFPHFDYRGGPLAHMAAFKQHCAIGFWKASLMVDNAKLIDSARSESAMGHLGKITSLKDLPGDSTLAKYIREGMRLNEQGIKIKAKKIPAATLEIPEYFGKALAANKQAKKTFEAFSNSNKKEYLVWVTEAKTEATRLKRLATAIEWMSQGKIRNWKYMK